MPPPVRALLYKKELQCMRRGAPCKVFSSPFSTPAAMRYCKLLLLLLVAIVPTQCFDNNPLDPALNWYMPYDLLQINMSAADTGTAYGLVMIDMLSRVIAGSTNNVYGRHVLAQQRVGQPPYRWLMLDLVGRADDRTMIAVRQDNIYVSAFTDKAGTWYVFKNVAVLNLIPGATTLLFDNDYSGLMGSDGYEALGSLVLGHEPTLAALGQLANYRPAPNGNLGGLPRAVALLVVTLTEAARFREIATQITNNWESGLALGDLNNLVVNWKTLSCSLLLAKQNNDVWEGSKEATHLGDPLTTGSASRPSSRRSMLFSSCSGLGSRSAARKSHGSSRCSIATQ